MATNQGSAPLGRFLVELTPAETGIDDIQALAARSRAACRDLTRQGMPVRFLRSVFLPDDGTCLLLFDATSAAAVEEAGRRAELHAGPVSELARPAVADGAERRGGRVP